jgi:hypothetical protein
VPIHRKHIGFSLPPGTHGTAVLSLEALSPSDTVLIEASATIELIVPENK